MVFVKVRETYDLHTVKNKMTVISIHTPKPGILKKNYPGLLMQCRAYRPVAADVRVACASVMPLDPQGVGLADGDVAPEDVFNPILYKAMSNKGMSQLESRINLLAHTPASQGSDVDGDSATVDVDSFTSDADEFPIYYGLLSQANEWKHANPQAGLSMTDLRPFVYEVFYNVGDQVAGNVGITNPSVFPSLDSDGDRVSAGTMRVLGSAKPMPFINCTSYTRDTVDNVPVGGVASGFEYPTSPANASIDVPWIPVVCGAIIVPPSRLHELFYRMVVEWTIEFSMIRPIGEITDWSGLAQIGNATHYQNYSYESTKEALTGSKDTILENDTCMVAANVDINKVM